MNPTPVDSFDIVQHVLDHLQTAVLLFDADLRLQFVNAAGEMLFAASARHILGQQACDLIQCPDALTSSNLSDALRTGRAYTEREVRLPLPEGREVTVDCSIIPINEPGLGPQVLVELQQVDRQLRISREEQLLLQHEATRDLVRGMAHEIKNPLGGLRGAAQLLAAELPSEELREYTGIIIAEADRLQVLVDRMLGPNKLPNQQAVNIHMVLERVRSLVAVEVGERVQLVRDYDPSIPDLYGDADQLIQSFLNIVRNAARAVGETGLIQLRTRVQRQFTIGNRRHKLVAQVDIVDNGPGIPEELREKIFYPMVSASEGGIGLGLSIAQSLISRHCGLIECRSRPGETVFTVLLPVES